MTLRGIDPSTIPYALGRVPARCSTKGFFATGGTEALVPDAETRLRAHPDGALFIKAQFGYDGLPPYIHRNERGDDFEWAKHWWNAPVSVLSEVFTAQEMLYLWYACPVECELTQVYEKEHPLLWKVQNCLWQYSSGTDFNRLSACIEGLKRLRVDIPGFEVRVTHSRSINTQGTAAHFPWAEVLSLDAAFAIVLYYEGKHVLTGGFAFTREGILVTQAQLRQKKGNRFLFKLPKHYVDVILDILGDAFGHDRLWIVDGRSAVAAIRRYYGKDRTTGMSLCKLSAADEERIASIYDRDMEGFRRDRGRVVRREGRTYYKLQPRRAMQVAA